MQEGQSFEQGKKAWSYISKIHANTGHHYYRIFDDWLELMLLTFLSQTAKVAGKETKHEEYERNYLDIVGAYADKRPKGKRNIDYFSYAMAELIEEMTVTEQDILGSLYMEHITSGENGQFFTPHPITQMMVQMLQPTEAGSISDPTCGSGRMLLEAHKMNPRAHLYGTDIDERCAKICALNLFLFGCRATVVWGNSLTLESWGCWDIGFVYIFERDPQAVVVQPKETPVQTIVPEKIATFNQLGFDLFNKGEA